MRIEKGVVVGNVEDKYRTKNPITKAFVRGVLSSLDELVRLTQARTVLEVGCGEGFLTERIRKQLQPKKIDGLDISVHLIHQAKKLYPKIGFSVENIEKTKRRSNSVDLVVACEILEHLPHPKVGLKQIHRITKKWAILSVPQEPLWRILNMIRLKYLKDFGNTPGHLNHWRVEQFLELIKVGGFKIVQVKKPIPWVMVLVRKV